VVVGRISIKAVGAKVIGRGVEVGGWSAATVEGGTDDRVEVATTIGVEIAGGGGVLEHAATIHINPINPARVPLVMFPSC
jgi:hypothetical protein